MSPTAAINSGVKVAANGWPFSTGSAAAHNVGRLRCLGTAQRVRSVYMWVEADCDQPIRQETGVLPCRYALSKSTTTEQVIAWLLARRC
jgi:hypothetical protein